MTVVHADDYVSGGVVSIDTVLSSNPDATQIILTDLDYRFIGGTLKRDNLIFCGKMPRVADDMKSLIGGSIIKGGMIWEGSNIGVYGVGFDRGETVCNTYFSGVEADALNVFGSNETTIGLQKDVVLQDVIGLCKASTSPFHAVSVAGFSRLVGRNIQGVRGLYGAVFKVKNSNVDGVIARGNGDTAIYIKSDANYGGGTPNPIGHDSYLSNYSNLQVVDPNQTIPFGLHVYAATESVLYGVNVNGYVCTGTQKALRVTASPRTGIEKVLRLNLQGINIHAPSTIGVEILGDIRESSVSNVNIYGPTSGKAFSTDADCNGLRVKNLMVSLVDANNYADAIKFSGKVWADTIHCTQGGDYTVKRGIKNSIEVISGVTYGGITNAWGNIT